MPLEISNLPNDVRRLPVYLIIDTSGSMDGAPIVALNEGLQMFSSIIKDDQQSRETAHVSIIEFHSTARQVLPLTEAAAFQPPAVTAQGSTSLSSALKVLREALVRELRPKSGDYLGDYKPLVYLMTDGQPNGGDPWRQELAELNKMKGRRPGLLVGIGAGPQADMDMIRELSPEHAYELRSLDREKLRQLFVWMAQSTVVASRPESHRVDAAPGQMLPQPPPNLFAA